MGSQTSRNCIPDLNPGFQGSGAVTDVVDDTIAYMTEQFDDILESTPLKNPPHFLMWFAAVAHSIFGIPDGGVGEDMPRDRECALRDLTIARSNLFTLADVLNMSEGDSQAMGSDLYRFWLYSQRSTQRISSRKPRFAVMYKALQPALL